jgi:hypothetical protein
VKVRAGEGLLRETFAQLRKCGCGRDECVVFWTGPADVPERVDRMVHPRHTSTAGHYEVDREWAVRFALELAAERRTVRLQIHSHPHEAFHSATDDAGSIVSVPGFLSLVVPDAAQGPVSLERACLAELQPDGNWRRVDPAELISVDR